MRDVDEITLFNVSFEEAIEDYEPAPILLKIRPKLGAVTHISEPLEIDTSEPFKFTAISKAEPGAEVQNYLEFSEREAPPGFIVRFYVEPSQKLLALDESNFKRIVREEFLVTVKVKAKGAKIEPSGKFRVRIEPLVKIHWEWKSYPLDFPDMSGKDKPVILQPDGKSFFKLKVWAVEWKNRTLVRSDPKAYEFTHWIDPEDRDMNTKIFAPEPMPWDPKIAKEPQDENDWYSKADLPALAQFPSFYYLPIDTCMRVKAWNRGSIKVRRENDVDADEVEVGEVEIPVRLVKSYILSIAVLLEEDTEPLKTYQERVNGEKVKIFCPNLTTDQKARIRWKVIGPRHYFTGKRKFQTEDNETSLTPVITPAGVACLGEEIQIVEQPCSEANPPIYLDVEAPVFAPTLEFLVTKDSIRGDEKVYMTARVKLLSTRPDGTLDKVSELKATFTVSGAGKLFKADKPDFSAPPLESPEGAETDVMADWTEQDGKITIGAEVEIVLEGYQDSKPLKAKGSTEVEVTVPCPPSG